MDFILGLAIGNLLVSAGIAIIAWAVQRHGRHPGVAHLLWLLVLVKLLTPPLVDVPVLPAILGESSSPLIEADSFGDPDPLLGMGLDSSDLTGAWPLLAESAPAASANVEQDAHSTAGAGARQTAIAILCFVWALGSVACVVVGLRRLLRFRTLLRRSALPTDPALIAEADELARAFALRQPPRLKTSTALVSPFVWWTGGRAEVVLPARVASALDPSALRMVLAHEFAHVRRHDHHVRWLAWTACVVFWWNPVAWWAARNLREHEEDGADRLVLEVLQPDRKRYAHALVSVAELLSAQAHRPPALASAMTRGGNLEHRLMRIIGQPLTKTPRWLSLAVVLCAAGTLPLSVTHAQDHKAVERRLARAVEAGEITLAQAHAMMQALQKTRSASTLQKELAAMRDQLRAKEAALAAEAKKRQAALDEYARLADPKRLDTARRRTVDLAWDLSAAKEEATKRKFEAAQRKRMADDLAAMKKDLAEAVRRGAMSKADAERLLQAQSDKWDEKARNVRWLDTRVDPRNGLRKRIQELREKLRIAVEKGDLEAADASRKQAALLKDMEAQLAQLQARHAEHTAIAHQIDVLRAEAEEARKRGETQKAKHLLQKAEALQKAHGTRNAPKGFDGVELRWSPKKGKDQNPMEEVRAGDARGKHDALLERSAHDALVREAKDLWNQASAAGLSDEAARKALTEMRVKLEAEKKSPKNELPKGP